MGNGEWGGKETGSRGLRVLVGRSCRPVMPLLVMPLLVVAVVSCRATPPAEQDGTTPASLPLFVDVAGEVGVDFFYFPGRSGGFHPTEVSASGLGTLDYDGDGRFDLYLPQGAMLGAATLEDASIAPPSSALPLIDRLFRNVSERRDDGSLALRFQDVTVEAGLQETGYGAGVGVGDIDNDGWPDVYVSNVGPNRLLRNRGDGTFEVVPRAGGAESELWSTAAVFFDYDGDGFLDLFVGNYVEWTPDDPVRCYRVTGARDYCGPLAYREVPDRLFRNRGDGRFEDVTVGAGLTTVFGSALGAVAFDANRDGWLDLYVSNDGRPNQLWINQGDGTFVDGAPARGAAVNALGQPEAGMGVEAEDLDADGDLDIFLAHLTGETNTLYVNDGSGYFDDRSTASGLAMPSQWATAFGAVAIDFDNDGLLDLFTANGDVRVIEEQDRAGIDFPMRQRNQLFRNLGGGRFAEVPPERAGPPFAVERVSRGAIVVDLDNDGDHDLVVMNTEGPVEVLHNTQGNLNPWIGFRVRSALGRDAYGAMVEVHRSGSGPRLVRRVGTDGSFSSARDPRVLVGLGVNSDITSVRVAWPDGAVEEWRGLAIRQYHLLQQGTGRNVPSS